MPLDYILRRFAQKTGIPCYPYKGMAVDEEHRQYALDIINEGAKELYRKQDLPGCLEECVCKVDIGYQVSLPSFVGSLRALREYNYQIAWKLSTMRPRYHDNSWGKDGIRNWRDKGERAIARDIVNEAPLTVVVDKVETPNIEVTITGSTATASRISETIVLSSTENVGTLNFKHIESIKKNRYNDYNITIKDVEDNELAVIYNNELSSCYTLIDVSDAFSNQGDHDIYVELLYKKPFREFVNNEDSFPVNGYDDVILNKALQIYSEDRENVEAAIAYSRKAEISASDIANDKVKGKDTQIEFQRHPHGEIFRRLKGRYY